MASPGLIINETTGDHEQGIEYYRASIGRFRRLRGERI